MLFIGLLSLLSYTTHDLLALPTQEHAMPPDLHTGQSDGADSSCDIPFSQITLTFVKLTKGT